jgi:L-alanine-DL-glutamate epimerase-like enolase superfamily enzyme
MSSGESGALFYGISAIDIALWDIAGKAAGAPVCRLLGGAGKAELTCYASLIRYSDPSLVRPNVRRAIDSASNAFSQLKLLTLSSQASPKWESSPRC